MHLFGGKLRRQEAICGAWQWGRGGGLGEPESFWDSKELSSRQDSV